MQTQLVAGETFSYRVNDPAYPASAGWALTLYLNPRVGGTLLTVVSAQDGDAHQLQATAAETAAWTAGAYAWEIWAALAGQRFRLESGQLQVVPSLIGASAGLDTRSQAQVVLDQLRAAWAAYASSGNFAVQELWVAGRKVTYRSVAELRAALNAAERDVRNEETAARVAAGLGGRQRFVVRM